MEKKERFGKVKLPNKVKSWDDLKNEKNNNTIIKTKTMAKKTVKKVDKEELVDDTFGENIIEDKKELIEEKEELIELMENLPEEKVLSAKEQKILQMKKTIKRLPPRNRRRRMLIAQLNKLEFN